MKKFLSLVCALTLVLSASAVPVKKLTRRAFELQKQELRAKKSFGALMQDAKTLKGEKFAKAEALRAPKAKQEATDVKIGSWDVEDWGSDGEFNFYAEDNLTAFYFDIIYGGDNTDLELGKTYTEADLYVDPESGEQYAGVFYDGNMNYGIKTLSIVKTVDEAGLVHFKGACVDSLDAAFTFHYDEEPFVLTGDTVAYAITTNAKMEYSSYWGDWTIKADDGVYGLRLDYYSEDATSPAGSYSSEDFDLGYTWVEIYTSADSSKQIGAHAAEATIVEVEGNYVIGANIIGEDGVVYIISATFTAPHKEAEAIVQAENLKVIDTYFSLLGIVLVTASNENFSDISFSLTADEEAESYFGTYTIGANASGYLTTTDSVEIELYSGTVTLAQTADGITLTGTALGYDNVEYTFNLTYVKPEQTREETITIDGLTLTILTGAWQIAGYNADSTKYVSIAAYADAVAGTYTEADLAANYCSVVTDIAGASYKQFALIEANLTVAYNEEAGTATVTGTFLGQNKDDVPLFTLNLSAAAPEPSPYLDYDTPDKAYKEVFEEYTVSDQYLAQYGDLIIKATNENNAYVGLDIYIEEGASTLTPGTYSFAKTEEPMTVYIGSCDGQSVSYSFFSYKDAEGYIEEMWFPVDGTLTVLENGVIEIVAVNSYGAQIECRIGAWPEAIDNTEAKAAATKTVRNGQLIILKNGNEYNAQGAMLK